MACGVCSERRQAIVSGVSSLAKGDLAPAAAQARLVVQSAGADIRKLALKAAHLRLKR